MRYELWRRAQFAPVVLNMSGQAAFIKNVVPSRFPAATRITIVDVIEWRKDEDLDGPFQWKPIILDRQTLKVALEDAGFMDEYLPFVSDYHGCLASVLSDPRSQKLREYLRL